MRQLISGLCAVAVMAMTAFQPLHAQEWRPTAQDVKIFVEADREEFLNMLKLIQEGSEAAGEAGNPALDLIKDQSREVDRAKHSVTARLKRGKTLLAAGAIEKALEDFAAATDLDVDSAAAWHMRGLAHERLGELPKALEFYRKAIKIDPDGAAGIAAKWDEQMLGFLTAPEQKILVEKLGVPDSFSIVVVADPNKPEVLHRQEIWDYYRLGKSFDFLDGVLAGETDMPGEPEGIADFLARPYRPYQFIGGMEFPELSDVIGQQNYAHIALGGDPEADGMLIYAPQLAMGFLHSRLFYVRTIPLFLAKN